MSRVAYVNGRYVPHREARVHIDDRGYQFADGVYEVVAIVGKRFVDEAPHLDRLERSLKELRMTMPMSRRSLELILRELVRVNRVRNGIVYVQMSRAVAPRDHPFPKDAKTQMVAWARSGKPYPAAHAEDGVKAVTMPDIRWGRCDIKSTALLPNVLAKQLAREAGAYEAWLIDEDGNVTEGSSSNAWIVTAKGELVTRSTDQAILSGITRRTVSELASEQGLKLVERKFSLAEAKGAREAFVTSASSPVVPVTQIDEQVIGNGKPGSISLKLRERYLRYMEEAGVA